MLTTSATLLAWPKRLLKRMLKSSSLPASILWVRAPRCSIPKRKSSCPADYVGSTSGIIDYAGSSDAKEFIIGTEGGVFYELETRNPDKVFYPAMEDAYCINMKKVTLEKVRDCLRDETNEVFVDAKIAGQAVRALERMLELAK